MEGDEMQPARAVDAAPLFETVAVTKTFGGFKALDNVSFHVRDGEFVSIVGPNGAGKTTLVNIVTGLLRPTIGEVRFHGRDIAGIGPFELARLGMARSFQLPRPFGTLSVAENLRIPLLYTAHSRRGGHLSHAEIESRCSELAGLVGLAPKINRLPRDLTQVEMRKLELARAMAADPKLLIADEAMAGLSQSEVNDIVGLLITLNERGITIIMIEHIMRAVMAFSQRLVVLVSGKKIADGKPQDVVNNDEVIGAYLGQ